MTTEAPEGYIPGRLQATILAASDAANTYVGRIQDANEGALSERECREAWALSMAEQLSPLLAAAERRGEARALRRVADEMERTGSGSKCTIAGLRLVAADLEAGKAVPDAD